RSNSPFITSVAPASGFGPSSVTFTVAANSGPARTGTLTVAGKTVAVNQSALSCSFVVQPLVFFVLQPGGGSTVTIQTQEGCAWAAASNDAFITNVSPASGVGSGTVSFNVPINLGGDRKGTLTVAGQTVTVNQADGCNFF